MTPEQELAEAEAFERRRLVAAFVSGAPGGRETEPPRRGRTVLAGVGLAAVVLAGAAVSARVGPRPVDGWDRPGVVIAKDTGARYLVTADGGVLRSLLNLTSAQLVLGMDYPVTVVAESDLAGAPRGPDIGIPDAPPELPSAAAVAATALTACTAGGAGVAVDVSASPPVTPLGDRGLVVRSGAHDYLLAQDGTGRARAYPVGLLGAQALFTRNGEMPAPIGVPRAWLALFGRPRSLRFPPDLKAVRTSAGYDVLRIADGRWEAMAVDSFAAHLIARGRPPLGRLPAGTRPNDHLLDGTSVAAWPDRLVDAAAAGPICLRLAARPGLPSLPSLVAPTGADAWPTPAPEPAAAPSVHVDPGGGAFLRPAAGADRRTFLIAATGRRYLLADRATLDTLGLTHSDAHAVDGRWLALFPTGPELARGAVLRAEPP